MKLWTGRQKKVGAVRKGKRKVESDEVRRLVEAGWRRQDQDERRFVTSLLDRGSKKARKRERSNILTPHRDVGGHIRSLQRSREGVWKSDQGGAKTFVRRPKGEQTGVGGMSMRQVHV